MWRWYSALLLSNALDLLFTYTAVERGFQEMNPLLQPVLLTPWPVLVKLAVFGLLGSGLWAMVRRSRTTGPVVSMLRAATVIYLIVVAAHIIWLFVMPGKS
jgi:hypothetical protein